MTITTVMQPPDQAMPLLSKQLTRKEGIRQAVGLLILILFVSSYFYKISEFERTKHDEMLRASVWPVTSATLVSITGSFTISQEVEFAVNDEMVRSKRVVCPWYTYSPRGGCSQVAGDVEGTKLRIHYNPNIPHEFVFAREIVRYTGHVYDGHRRFNLIFLSISFAICLVAAWRVYRNTIRSEHYKESPSEDTRNRQNDYKREHINRLLSELRIILHCEHAGQSTALTEQIQTLMIRSQILSKLPRARKEVRIEICEQVAPGTSVDLAHTNWTKEGVRAANTIAPEWTRGFDAPCPQNVWRLELYIVDSDGSGMGSHYGFDGTFVSILATLSDGTIWDARAEKAS